MTNQNQILYTQQFNRLAVLGASRNLSDQQIYLSDSHKEERLLQSARRKGKPTRAQLETELLLEVGPPPLSDCYEDACLLLSA